MDKPEDVAWILPDGTLHVEYDKLMNLGIPDDSHYTENLGHRIWGLFHGIANNYGCNACKYDAQTWISFIHDMVNLKLGKGIHDRKRFDEALSWISELSHHDHSFVMEHEVLA